MTASNGGYYLPQPSYWPIVGSVGLFLTLGGFAHYLHNGSPMVMMAGVVVLLVMIFGWFGTVIRESQAGKYNDQVDMSFRMGMGWFIFSEVMFFAAFFGALFYIRMYAVPWLGGGGNKGMTPELLWPGFEAMWPTNGPGDVGGEFEPMAGLGHSGHQHPDPALQRRDRNPGALGAEKEPARRADPVAGGHGGAGRGVPVPAGP